MFLRWFVKVFFQSYEIITVFLLSERIGFVMESFFIFRLKLISDLFKFYFQRVILCFVFSRSIFLCIYCNNECF